MKTSTVPAAGAADLPALQRRITAVLITSQVLGGIGIGIGIAFATVIGAEVGGDDGLAGLAATATVVGTALLSIPLTPLMSARGRRPSLALAYLTGATGAGLVVLASVVGSYPLLLVGMAALGGGSTANFQARFAAADLTPPERRGRSISLLVWATTIGAVLGPNLAAPAARSVAGLGISAAAGPFLWACGAFAAAAAIVAGALRPDPLLTARALDPESTGSSTASHSIWSGLRVIRASPRGRLALATVAVVHTAMASVMSMTPMDMAHHGAGIDLIGFVVSCHVLGMYAFSPVMGWLADRIGRITVICLSSALLAMAALLAGTAGHSHVQSAVALFLLGLGWSAGLVSGSALLTDSVPSSARAAAQGLSDLTMSSAAGIGTAVAGLVVAQAGYGWLNAAVVCALLPFGALALRVRGLRRPERQ